MYSQRCMGAHKVSHESDWNSEFIPHLNRGRTGEKGHSENISLLLGRANRTLGVVCEERQCCDQFFRFLNPGADFSVLEIGVKSLEGKFMALILDR